MNKKFKIPVLLSVRADNRADARAKVRRIMRAASEDLLNNEPKLHHAWRWWDFANVVTRTRAKLRAETRHKKLSPDNTEDEA